MTNQKTEEAVNAAAAGVINILFPHPYEPHYIVLASVWLTGAVLFVSTHAYATWWGLIDYSHTLGIVWSIIGILMCTVYIGYTGYLIITVIRKKKLDEDTLGGLFLFYMLGMFGLTVLAFFELLSVYGLSPNASPVPLIIQTIRQSDKPIIFGIALIGLLAYFLLSALRIILIRFLNVDMVGTVVTSQQQFSTRGNVLIVVAAVAVVLGLWYATENYPTAMFGGYLIVSTGATLLLRRISR